MSRKTPHPLKFDSFEQVYINLIIKLKKDNPDFVRLDGRIEGSNRTPFAYFYYQDKCWKIDADTWLEKLDHVYKLIQNNEDPFEIRPTRKNLNKCLVIKGEPLTKKKFYVYLTGLSTDIV